MSDKYPGETDQEYWNRLDRIEENRQRERERASLQQSCNHNYHKTGTISAWNADMVMETFACVYCGHTKSEIE